jgi:uncharacterized protein (DUF1330 family)
MAAYLIVQLDVHDPDRFKRYMQEARDSDAEYGAQILAVDANADVLEGAWFGNRTVVARFESKAQAHAWFSSSGYQRASEHRRAASVTNMVVIDGLA